MVIPLPSLEDAIERQFLTVSVNDSLANALSVMSSGCRYDDPSCDREALRRASCVLVVDGDRLEGILTERDVVKLTATGALVNDLTVAQVMTRNVLTICEADRLDVSDALLWLRQYHIRHLPVVDAAGKLTGLVTPASIRRVLQPSNLLKLRHVRDVMATLVQSASGAVSVQQLAEQMARERVSSIVVVDVDTDVDSDADVKPNQVRVRPLGIVTERDIVQFRLMNLDLGHTSAREVMSSPLRCLHPHDSLAVAHAEMQRMRVHRLVVIGDRGELVGIVTQTSMLQAIDLSEIHGTIGTLKQLVSDRTRTLQSTNQQLRDEVAKRIAAEGQLQTINEMLEQRVRERTAELEASNAKLQDEIRDRERAQARLQDYEEHLEQLVAKRTAELEVANQSLAREVVERRQVERELFREKELAQVTLQSIGDAVVTTDARGRITYLNALAETYTGWSLDCALDRPINDICTTIREDNRQPAADTVSQVLQHGAIVHSTEAVVLRSRQGQELAIEST
ncbi:MAG: CBS domain-containing protein, partial [Cyanobacteria bacterium J06648_11]